MVKSSAGVWIAANQSILIHYRTPFPTSPSRACEAPPPRCRLWFLS